MSENKSIGGALVDVFDAAVSLVKTEVTLLARRIGQIAKAKGLGVVLLLGAVAPLTMALIFLILAVFYGLMRLGLGAWAAALVIALVSFVVTGVLVMMGIKKLTADVDDGTGHGRSDHDHDAPRPQGQAHGHAAATAAAGGERPHGDIMNPETRAQHEREREQQQRRMEEMREQRERERQYVAEHGIPVSTKPTFEEDMK
ncbi:phage holin family protein [Deinococcus maricopensis]|uniref:Phage holin family protein n=1 Tax=Deinococcus maricopensis (strain DSM 21211 / LMG 22137 / NRRL B-23946 / LB-34) TaxID=709986 RepID=E8UAN0_DEIML|nr:phage holin family protein [Deinococcus maricopensis]ADV68119.1 hypothetical protein Deima_2484 [Deinococcus maricopensis DSM 21211]